MFSCLIALTLYYVRKKQYAIFLRKMFRRMGLECSLCCSLLFLPCQKADQISRGDSDKSFQIFTQVHQRGRVGKEIGGLTTSVCGKETRKFRSENLLYLQLLYFHPYLVYCHINFYLDIEILFVIW